MPTGAWQCAAWEDRIYGIPFQSGGFNLGGQYFFRGDVFDDKGIKADEITSMDALFSLGKELTDAKGGVWAFDDLWGPVGPLAMYDIPSKFAVVDGKLKSVYELPQFAEALDWCHKAAKAGLIHPDALAGNSNDYKKRFYAGKALITADGSGSWNLADAQNGQAANPKFRRDSFKPFSADGTSAPKVYVQPTSRMFSYLNINLKPAQIEECLRIADFVAAPYGSREWLLINYGVEGVHWTKTAQGPTFTKTGIADVQPTTIPFLAAGPSVNANLGAPDITRAVCAWQAEAVKYAAKSPFWNMNITVPKRLATADAAQAVEDTIKDVVHGIKPVSSFQDALSTWKGSGGGDRLVAWYQTEVMDKLGTGL
jgi:putative aldouronate transport system substrate-binding protein